jgi:6,7-dimethyl-8-ribityllumazine synthase
MRLHHTPAPVPVANPRWRIGIVHSTYYAEEIFSMVETAEQLFVAAGIPAAQVTRHPAPGSYEVPLIGASLVKAGKVDALIGFGIIVQGETEHARLIAEAAVQGMMQIQVQHAIPFACEILWVPSLEHARARALGEGNKGEEAARAVLAALHQMPTAA